MPWGKFFNSLTYLIIMGYESLLSGILTSLLVSPIIIFLTYYLSSKHDYYRHLFALICEIEYNIKEMDEYFQYLETLKKPIEDGKKPVNQYSRKFILSKSHMGLKSEISYNGEIKNYLYDYLSDEAFFQFNIKGYSTVIQHKKTIKELIINPIKSIFSDNYIEYPVKGGVYSRISRFYNYCLNFNNESQYLEEKVITSKINEKCSYILLLEGTYWIYHKMINDEYKEIPVKSLKIIRKNFYLTLILIIISIFFVIYYIINLDNFSIPLPYLYLFFCNPLLPPFYYPYFLNAF